MKLSVQLRDVGLEKNHGNSTKWSRSGAEGEIRMIQENTGFRLFFLNLLYPRLYDFKICV
jgi:hypothetical protein